MSELHRSWNFAFNLFYFLEQFFIDTNTGQTVHRHTHTQAQAQAQAHSHAYRGAVPSVINVLYRFSTKKISEPMLLHY